MFKQDWFSILVLEVALILFSPFNPVLERLYTLSFVAALGLFLTLSFLLLKLDTLKSNKYIPILLKALKLYALASIIIIVLVNIICFLLFVISDIIGGNFGKDVYSAAAYLPKTFASTFEIHLNFFLLIPFVVLVAKLLRQKYKPQNIKVTDHLVG